MTGKHSYPWTPPFKVLLHIPLYEQHLSPQSSELKFQKVYHNFSQLATHLFMLTLKMTDEITTKELSES